MRNELLWCLMLVCNFSCIIFIYKKFGRVGLYVWIPICTILANIQVVMLVNLFGLDTTLGNILYAGGFLVTDILSENYGKKAATNAVKIGFCSLIASTLIMQIAINFIPLDVDDGSELFESVKNIFSMMPRLTIASLCAYLVSQFHDVWAYEFWRSKFSSKKYIWIRNNLSTMVSQILDTLIFCTIAFYGVLPSDIIVSIFISTYVIKFMVGALDTPFIYLASYLKEKDKITEI